MDLVGSEPDLDLYDPSWPIYTHRPVAGPAKIANGSDAHHSVDQTIISAGAVIKGGTVSQSVLSPEAHLDHAEVSESILMDRVRVEAGARLRKTIVAEGVTIPSGMSIGFDPETDSKRFVVTEDGVTVVPSRIVLDE